jgi:Gp157 protein
MRSLYEIGEDLHALEEMLTDTEGEIPEGEIGAAIEEWFDQLGEERDEKIRRMCALIEMMRFSAEACDEEARRLAKLRRASENGAERLKERLKKFFEEHKIQKLDLRIFKPRIQINGGFLPLIYPQEWELVPANAPERFHRRVVLLDKEAMRAEAEQVADEIRKLKDKLAREEMATDEYEWALEELLNSSPVQPGERATHLRLR